MENMEMEINKEKKCGGLTNGYTKKLAALLAVVTFTIIIAGLMASTIFLSLQLKDELCVTEECVKAAGEILKAMNKSVNPCEDFYQFSCGNWIQNNPIPDDALSWNQLDVLDKEVNRKIREIIESKPSEKDPNSVKLAKQFFKSFMSSSTDQSELELLLQNIFNRTNVNTTFGVKLEEFSSQLKHVFVKNESTLRFTRLEKCLLVTNAWFGMPISYHYVSNVFSSGSKIQVEVMAESIQKMFIESFDEINWIGNEATRDLAKGKLSKLNTLIGYPDWLLNVTALDSYYYGLKFSSPENFEQNFFETLTWMVEQIVESIDEPEDKKQWFKPPTTVVAFYFPGFNSITIPAGFLQPPYYFAGKAIQALNYGTVGTVIGHEIAHGFDSTRRHIDGDGNEGNWWDEETVQRYDEMAQCFIDQYSSYKIDDVKNITINGENTFRENIADNWGLSQAFKAYKSFVESHGPESKLPGLDYTPDQLFFIAFAQAWCGHYTEQDMERLTLEGKHSPEQFRVKGAVANSKEFKDTWKCQSDARKMCKI